MDVSSQYVGLKLKPFQAIISPRDSMNYAAAIGDNNAVYFDDSQDKNIVAHPLQAIAATWPLLGSIWEYIDADNFPLQILSTQVHYSEHLQLHRLINPGEKLDIKGEIAAILPHRAGTHMITRLDAFDENGQLVFSEYIGALMRGVTCLDEGRGAENLPAKISPPQKQVAPIWQSPIAIDPLMAFTYDAGANIHFPIHTSKRFAQQVGLKEPILQGSATLALAVTEMVNREANGDPARLLSIQCGFSATVIAGTQICVELLEKVENKEGIQLLFQVLNGDGKVAIRNGRISLKATHKNNGD